TRVGVRLHEDKEEKKKTKAQEREVCPPLRLCCTPAVGAAGVTKKALWEFHTRTGQGEVAVSTLYEPE
ncbi:Hok/Gef family protein, partial [Escherichia coli]|uniref:Hok/Gef family protein n=1 Tax=Escherichia coli TaxID=562 RepID=UPI001BFDA57E